MKHFQPIDFEDDFRPLLRADQAPTDVAGAARAAIQAEHAFLAELADGPIDGTGAKRALATWEAAKETLARARLEKDALDEEAAGIAYDVI